MLALCAARQERVGSESPAHLVPEEIMQRIYDELVALTAPPVLQCKLCSWSLVGFRCRGLRAPTLQAGRMLDGDDELMALWIQSGGTAPPGATAGASSAASSSAPSAAPEPVGCGALLVANGEDGALACPRGCGGGWLHCCSYDVRRPTWERCAAASERAGLRAEVHADKLEPLLMVTSSLCRICASWRLSVTGARRARDSRGDARRRLQWEGRCVADSDVHAVRLERRWGFLRRGGGCRGPRTGAAAAKRFLRASGLPIRVDVRGGVLPQGAHRQARRARQGIAYGA